MNENTIWNEQQNNPELVIWDAIKAFNLSENQANELRQILLRRGINKWLWGRRLFIKLKHDVKAELKEAFRLKYPKPERMILQRINSRMQEIAKLPRWIEWPKTTSRRWNKIEPLIEIKGKRC